MTLPLVTPQNLVTMVHTCWKRDDVLYKCIDSIEASDIGKKYRVVRHPEELPMWQPLVAEAWREISTTSGIEWILFLEDDTRINKQIIQNLSTWTAVQEPLFGAGWIAYLSPSLQDFRCKRVNGHAYRLAAGEFPAAGLLIPTAYISFLLSRMPPDGQWVTDILVSNGVWHMGSGKRVFYHEPALVYIDHAIPSAMQTEKFWHGSRQQNFLADGVVPRGRSAGRR